MKIQWVWVKNKQLGPIVIGDEIQKHIETLAAMLEEADGSEWDTYTVPDEDVYIDVENHKVVSISAYTEFFYCGYNVIGMTIHALTQLLDCKADDIGEPIEYEDGDIKISYDFVKVGLQVWCSEDVITSVTCLVYD